MNKMLITKEVLTEMLNKYLNRQITLEKLVNWAEEMICEGDFDKKDFELIKNILARLGLADVKEFGLYWEDCYEFIHRLGHMATVSIS